MRLSRNYTCDCAFVNFMGFFSLNLAVKVVIQPNRRSTGKRDTCLYVWIKPLISVFDALLNRSLLLDTRALLLPSPSEPASYMAFAGTQCPPGCQPRSLLPGLAMKESGCKQWLLWEKLNNNKTEVLTRPKPFQESSWWETWGHHTQLCQIKSKWWGQGFFLQRDRCKGWRA